MPKQVGPHRTIAFLLPTSHSHTYILYSRSSSFPTKQSKLYSVSAFAKSACLSQRASVLYYLARLHHHLGTANGNSEGNDDFAERDRAARAHAEVEAQVLRATRGGRGWTREKEREREREGQQEAEAEAGGERGQEEMDVQEMEELVALVGAKVGVGA